MTIEEFITACSRDGFSEVVRKTWPAGTVVSDHSHAWDARLLVVAGAMELTIGGVPRSHRPGDTCEVARDQVHAERYGSDQDVQLVICRRS